MPKKPEKRAKSPYTTNSGKRTEEQQAFHRAETARWLNREPGTTLNEMARRLGISVMTASNDLRWCLEQWRRIREIDTAAHADNEYAQLVATRREAWKGWHDSRTEQEVISAAEDADTTTERAERQARGDPTDGTATAEVVPVRERKRSRHSVRRSTSPGDPRFIAQGLQANAGLEHLAQSNPLFMADMLAALDRAGLLNHAALGALGDGVETDVEGDHGALGDDPELVPEERPAALGAPAHPCPR